MTLTREQKNEYQRQWRAKHPDYFLKGGRGYESNRRCNSRKVVCACGRVTDAQHLRGHERTGIHNRLMSLEVADDSD